MFSPSNTAWLRRGSAASAPLHKGRDIDVTICGFVWDYGI
jgi:hypothetical protein